MNKVFNIICFVFLCFAFYGCVRPYIHSDIGVGETELMLAVAKNSRASEFAPYNLKKAEEYLKLAQDAEKKRKRDESSFFLNISRHESMLAIVYSKEGEKKERLKSELQKMEEAKAIMLRGKSELDEVKNKLK